MGVMAENGKYGELYRGNAFQKGEFPYTVFLTESNLQSKGGGRRIAFLHEIRLWCAQNTTWSWGTVCGVWPLYGMTFYFRSEDDAVMFKMVWA